ncbi:hypothetical protein A2331_01165 [Candidatus Falkowbacteria bacterium RIFOXYB2_FULL_34_18]|uniref:Uncharacterized protein n=1 Tax=Candidatus Falkowbacteria bacterium RIFOXYD2_FULL_34_120 TaxID=1798007 RepID=A0A1F5TPD0_9BACT|nr:MAG: hypothetical protein A2331_01165 [Candidatus Falkowbacteria bacterium RIFOXYB2_FULL_34_18]OGF29124.1 MAG: hypothetical protein A2500_02775 [Candidatus Falkowbacteria bacterium RIFOXYC12_FULL_34_55]OGF36220.1 MAG: hypothetical protein A2466_04945 [Candidatus Falkowbacteria bacterium RIFOXYC2_FULL_34_220]OGF38634.1 MAG: hypothetical protein A2515_06905 [Candidatus Falkowbacteria bacterium RIFOXYD12_FULL_34_57]OGF40823.1 MAG: hypothetical protein A2531_06610 [Candidatus Falkowbacteria bact
MLKKISIQNKPAFSRKKLITISLLIVVLFSLMGCNKQTSQNSNQTAKNSIKNGPKRPDFGQPEEKPNISGLIKNVIGNEVTILKIEMPNRETANENTNNENLKVNQQQNSAPRTNLTRTFGGGGTGGDMGMRGGTRPEMTDENRAQMMERIKSMSTGEDRVTIPVGIRMLKISNGEPVEATLEDIKQDKMLMIWIDKNITDRNIATFVVIN